MKVTKVESFDEEKVITPRKAIRAYCLECCCGQPGEVRKCPKTDCPLYDFRQMRKI